MAAMLAPAGSAALLAQEPASAAGQVVARPRVLRTGSAVLFEALAGVHSDLGFDALADELIRDLVIARVVEPASCPTSTEYWPSWVAAR